MKTLDITSWNRRLHFEHFKQLKDPYFGVTVSIDASQAYEFSKNKGISFFGRYLHDCMKAINDVENMRYRIINEEVVDCEIIHASPTISRKDNTYGFSFIEFDNDLDVFLENFNNEKLRIQRSDDLFPSRNGVDCIHCSALPWIDFKGHKEPVSGSLDSVPKLAFGKIVKGKMNVAISVNHALVDGYHVGLFIDKFQFYLNN